MDEDRIFPDCDGAQGKPQSSVPQSLQFTPNPSAGFKDVQQPLTAQCSQLTICPGQSPPLEVQKSHPRPATDVVYAVNRWLGGWSALIKEYTKEEHEVMRVFENLEAANAAASKLLTFHEGDGFEVDSRILEGGGKALHAEHVSPSGHFIRIIDLEVQKTRLQTALPRPPSTTIPASSLPADGETYCWWRTVSQVNECTVYALGTFQNKGEASKASRRPIIQELRRIDNESMEEPLDEGYNESPGSFGVAVLDSAGITRF